MKFNSQIATSREQSERLLALGLKKETADMYRGILVGGETIVPKEEADMYKFYDEPTPAWSLGRLIEMALKDVLICGISFTFNEDTYKKVIGIIEY